MGDFRAAVGRVDLAILPVSLVQNPVGIAEVRKVAVAHVEEDRLVLALEEVQTKFARLPKRSVNQDVRKEEIGGGLLRNCHGILGGQFILDRRPELFLRRVNGDIQIFSLLLDE